MQSKTSKFIIDLLCVRDHGQIRDCTSGTVCQAGVHASGIVLGNGDQDPRQGPCLQGSQVSVNFSSDSITGARNSEAISLKY